MMKKKDEKKFQEYSRTDSKLNKSQVQNEKLYVYFIACLTELVKNGRRE